MKRSYIWAFWDHYFSLCIFYIFEPKVAFFRLEFYGKVHQFSSGLRPLSVKKTKLRHAWNPERFCEVATDALQLLPLKALAQNVQD